MLNKKYANSSLTQYSDKQSIQNRLAIFDNRRSSGLPLSIEDLTTLLDANWDFSFKYKNIIYEIVHDNNQIFLYEVNPQTNSNKLYKSYLSAEDLVNSATILGKPFVDVWIKSQYI